MDSLVYNELKEIRRYLIDCVLEELNFCQYVTVANVFTLNDDFPYVSDSKYTLFS